MRFKLGRVDGGLIPDAWVDQLKNLGNNLVVPARIVRKLRVAKTVTSDDCAKFVHGATEGSVPAPMNWLRIAQKSTGPGKFNLVFDKMARHFGLNTAAGFATIASGQVRVFGAITPTDHICTRRAPPHPPPPAHVQLIDRMWEVLLEGGGFALLEKVRTGGDVEWAKVLPTRTARPPLLRALRAAANDHVRRNDTKKNASDDGAVTGGHRCAQGGSRVQVWFSGRSPWGRPYRSRAAAPHQEHVFIQPPAAQRAHTIAEATPTHALQVA
jgi:hypothetical protein